VVKGDFSESNLSGAREVIECWGVNYNLGNVLKHLSASTNPALDALQKWHQLQEAAKHLDCEISRLESLVEKDRKEKKAKEEKERDYYGGPTRNELYTEILRGRERELDALVNLDFEGAGKEKKKVEEMLKILRYGACKEETKKKESKVAVTLNGEKIAVPHEKGVVTYSGLLDVLADRLTGIERRLLTISFFNEKTKATGVLKLPGEGVLVSDLGKYVVSHAPYVYHSDFVFDVIMASEGGA
jgi:hypothetical protein